MSLWDKYKLSSLPEEQRVEVIKSLISETEKTKQVQATDENFQSNRVLTRFWTVVAVVACFGIVGGASYCSAGKFLEAAIVNHTPFVCPPSKVVAPAFDIKLVPAASSTSTTLTVDK